MLGRKYVERVEGLCEAVPVAPTPQRKVCGYFRYFATERYWRYLGVGHARSKRRLFHTTEVSFTLGTLFVSCGKPRTVLRTLEKSPIMAPQKDRTLSPFEKESETLRAFALGVSQESFEGTVVDLYFRSSLRMGEKGLWTRVCDNRLTLSPPPFIVPGKTCSDRILCQKTSTYGSSWTLVRRSASRSPSTSRTFASRLRPTGSNWTIPVRIPLVFFERR